MPVVYGVFYSFIVFSSIIFMGKIKLAFRTDLRYASSRPGYLGLSWYCMSVAGARAALL